MKRIIGFDCPGCKQHQEVPVDLPDLPTIEQITSSFNEVLKGKQGISADSVHLIEELLKDYGPKAEDHRHKTADEFLDCPECRGWMDKTATRYQIVAKPQEQPPPAQDKPPEQAALPLGGIFKKEA